MRLIQRPWLFLLALCFAAPLVLGAGCSKDEEASVEAEADPTADESDESDLEDGEEPESEEADDEGSESEEAESEEADDEEADEPKGTDKKSPSSPDVASKEKAKAVAKAAPVGRADKARDRVIEARAGKPDQAAKGEPAANGNEPAEAVAPATEEGAQPADGDALLSPAERRKAERERRIAELKRRNEERRKERMSKVDEQRREAEAVAKVAPAPVDARVAPKGLELKKYVTQAQVRKLLGNDTLVEEGGLAGIEPSERYNSVYFAPPVRSSFGLSVQVWRDKTRRDANVRFRRMRSQYANAEDATSPTAKSFFSQWDDILTLSFADLTKRAVVSVSCSMEICKPAKLLDVAKSISSKL